MSKPQIEIITAADDGYLAPLSVMLHSLALTLHPDFHANVRILTSALREDSEGRLAQALAPFPVSIQVVRVKAELLDGLKITGHVSVETYLRLLSPTLFPHLEKALYLDADLVVRKSVHELYGQCVSGVHLLAVPHISKLSATFGAERGIPAHRILGIPADTQTFNAGVMLLNLSLWRETAASEQIFRYLRDYRAHVLWWDQDGLNVVLHDSWRPLPVQWNLMTSHFSNTRTWMDSTLDEQTYRSIQADPAIVHFSYVPKPWTGDYSGPFGDLWHHHWKAVSHWLQPGHLVPSS